jgi:hypothetical protein
MQTPIEIQPRFQNPTIVDQSTLLCWSDQVRHLFLDRKQQLFSSRLTETIRRRKDANVQGTPSDSHLDVD